jgi:hypothetical protein
MALYEALRIAEQKGPTGAKKAAGIACIRALGELNSSQEWQEFIRERNVVSFFTQVSDTITVLNESYSHIFPSKDTCDKYPPALSKNAEEENFDSGTLALFEQACKTHVAPGTDLDILADYVTSILDTANHALTYSEIEQACVALLPPREFNGTAHTPLDMALVKILPLKSKFRRGIHYYWTVERNALSDDTYPGLLENCTPEMVKQVLEALKVSKYLAADAIVASSTLQDSWSKWDRSVENVEKVLQDLCKQGKVRKRTPKHTGIPEWKLVVEGKK